jgi:hypothetical protein
MISTVTTSTVTTVTSVALAGSITLMVVLALLAFLIHKEILSVASDARGKALNKVLNVAVVPLVISFVFIAVVKVAEVLR